jgi:hypothetical protein
MPDGTWLTDIDIGPDGKVLICGYTGEPLFRIGYLALADKTGNVHWERQYEDPDGEILLHDATFLTGGGYAAGGEIRYTADDSRDFYLIKTDANGLISE